MLLSSVLKDTPSPITVALHLSNVQKLQFEKWDTNGRPTSEPRIYNVDKCRELYTILSQAPKKVKVALSKFNKGGVILWAPDDSRQVGNIVNAVIALAEEGTEVEVHLLFRYKPLPTCATPESIMDLWSPNLMYTPRAKEHLQDIIFYAQSCKCVVTRNSNPHYAMKDLARLVLVGKPVSQAIPRMASMIEDSETLFFFQLTQILISYTLTPPRCKY